MREVRIVRPIQADTEELREQLVALFAEWQVRVEPAKEGRSAGRLRLTRPELPHARLAEEVVAPEDLVGALAGQHDLRAMPVDEAAGRVQGCRSRAHQHLLGVEPDG